MVIAFRQGLYQVKRCGAAIGRPSFTVLQWIFNALSITTNSIEQKVKAWSTRDSNTTTSHSKRQKL